MNSRKKRRLWLWIGAVMTLAAALASAVCFALTDISAEEAIANNDEVVGVVRNGLREHAREIKISFAYPRNILPHISDFVEEWMEAATEETPLPTEGDYIRYQNGGYENRYSCEKVGEQYRYTVVIAPKYYLYLVQEERVTAKLEEIFDSFDFDENTSDYHKIRVIYDYICQHVRYDEVHKKNPHYFLRSTAYGALVQQTATCQGYCVALYRMLRHAGVNARIITGTSDGESGLHAWNIVALDGTYYNLDATWDAGREEYGYFLKGENDFLDHERGKQFSTKVFMEQYPMAAEDFAVE